MSERRSSLGARAAVAILAAMVFVTAPCAAQQEAVLHSFGNDTDGRYADSGLIIDSSGNLFGTTGTGGVYDLGTVFELSPRQGGGWTETVLHSFNGSDGAYPFASLILDSAGNLY